MHHGVFIRKCIWCSPPGCGRQQRWEEMRTSKCISNAEVSLLNYYWVESMRNESLHCAVEETIITSSVFTVITEALPMRVNLTLLLFKAVPFVPLSLPLQFYISHRLNNSNTHMHLLAQTQTNPIKLSPIATLSFSRWTGPPVTCSVHLKGLVIMCMCAHAGERASVAGPSRREQVQSSVWAWWISLLLDGRQEQFIFFI